MAAVGYDPWKLFRGRHHRWLDFHSVLNGDPRGNRVGLRHRGRRQIRRTAFFAALLHGPVADEAGFWFIGGQVNTRCRVCNVRGYTSDSQ